MRRNNLSSLLIFIGALLYISIFYTPFSFASNDDAVMMSILNGTYTGHPEGYAVFIHPILSEFISLLYKFNNQLPWYPLLWFVFSFLAYVAVVRAVAFRGGKVIYQLFWIISYLLFSLHHLFFLQFTVVAGVLGLSGYLLLLETKAFSRKKSESEEFFPIFLIMLSAMVRIEVFFLVTIGVALFYGLKYGYYKLLILFSIGKYIWICTILLIGIVPLYEQANGYKEYSTFNKARAMAIDHPVLRFKTDEINRIENPDLFYFRNWLFEDNPNINLAFLQKLRRNLNLEYFKSDYFFHGFKRIFNFYQNHNYSLFTLLFYFLLLLSVDTVKKKNLLFVIVWILFFLFFNHFYLVPHRVQTLFALHLWGAAWLCQKQISVKPKLLNYLVPIISFFILIHMGRVTRSFQFKKEIIKEYNFVSHWIPQNEIAFTDLIGIESMDPKIFKNNNPFIYFGWHSRSPMQAGAFSKFGYDNLGEIRSYYFLTTCGNELLIPDYLNYLNRYNYKRELITRKGDFLLFKFTM